MVVFTNWNHMTLKLSHRYANLLMVNYNNWFSKKSYKRYLILYLANEAFQNNVLLNVLPNWSFCSVILFDYKLNEYVLFYINWFTESLDEKLLTAQQSKCSLRKTFSFIWSLKNSFQLKSLGFLSVFFRVYVFFKCMKLDE